MLWCIYHHHQRHRPGVQLIGDATNLTMITPDGRTIPLASRGPTTQKARSLT